MNELEKCMAGEYYDCHDRIFLDFKAHARDLLKELAKRLTPDWTPPPDRSSISAVHMRCRLQSAAAAGWAEALSFCRACQSGTAA